MNNKVLASGCVQRALDERPYQVGYASFSTSGPNFDWYGGPVSTGVELDADAKRAHDTAAFRQWMNLLRDINTQHSPLRPEDLPVQQIVMHRRPKSLADQLPGMGGSGSRQRVVSERCRDLIEALEPGRHWFFPYELLCPDHTPWPRRYYLLATVQTRQALIVEQSPGFAWEPYVLRHSGITRRLVEINGRNCTKTLDASMIAGLHVWLETAWDGWLFFSAELVRQIRKRNLTGFAIRESDRVNLEQRRFPPPVIFNQMGASG